jgi:hypothetical protein
MQPLDVSPLAGAAQSTADHSAVHPRLGFLVRQFHRAVERQRARDEEWIATFERVAGDPRVRRLIQQIICEKELSRHG